MNVNKIYKNTFVLISIFLGYFSYAFGIELNMYYPVAVGGPLTKIVDGMVALEALRCEGKRGAFFGIIGLGCFCSSTNSLLGLAIDF